MQAILFVCPSPSPRARTQEKRKEVMGTRLKGEGRGGKGEAAPSFLVLRPCRVSNGFPKKKRKNTKTRGGERKRGNSLISHFLAILQKLGNQGGGKGKRKKKKGRGVKGRGPSLRGGGEGKKGRGSHAHSLLFRKFLGQGEKKQKKKKEGGGKRIQLREKRKKEEGAKGRWFFSLL